MRLAVYAMLPHLMDASDDTEKTARGFRVDRRPLAMMLLANLVVAVICLGVPYYRGKLHAEASLRAFSRFAGCMLGARPEPSSGLGMPSGDRAAFASQVLRAPADWPGGCSKALAAIAPPHEFFLWPSFKHAASDVDAVVALLQTELASLTRRRQVAPGRVPERPLLALTQLRASLALLAKAADVDRRIDRNAVAFVKRELVPEPARLPLMAGSMASLQMWSASDGLHALALDTRGISQLHLRAGKIARQRVKRTGLVRAALRETDLPLLVWAMSGQRCKLEEDHCARRATGVARLRLDAATLPVPAWLSGHPAFRVDKSVRMDATEHVDLLAQEADLGSAEIRRYAIAEATQGEAHGEGQTPLAPTQRFPVAATLLDAHLLHGQKLAYLSKDADGTGAWLSSYAVPSAPIALGRVQGEGGWMAACEREGERWFAFGSSSELATSRVGSDGAVTTLQAAAPLPLGEPVDAEDPARDRVRLLCDRAQATLLILGSDRKLRGLRCSAQACQPHVELANDVAVFDAASADEVTLVAYARSRSPEQVVLRLDAALRPLAPSHTPAACWDPVSGMCGQPTWLIDGKRILLAARDGADLLVIESADGGRAWKTLSGLQGQRAKDDASAPMDQHRLRKGL